MVITKNRQTRYDCSFNAVKISPGDFNDGFFISVGTSQRPVSIINGQNKIGIDCIRRFTSLSVENLREEGKKIPIVLW